MYDCNAVEQLLIVIAHSPPRDVQNVQPQAIRLLCEIASRVDREKLIEMGNDDAILITLSFISKREECDSTLCYAWKLIELLIDEIRQNQIKFVKAGGIRLLIICYNRFFGDRKLLRHIVWCIVTLAKVKCFQRLFLHRAVIRPLHQNVSIEKINYDPLVHCL